MNCSNWRDVSFNAWNIIWYVDGWRFYLTQVHNKCLRTFQNLHHSVKRNYLSIKFVLFLYLSNSLSRIQLGKMRVDQLLLILLSHICLCFPGGFLPSFLATEVLYALLTCTIRSKCHMYPVLQAFNTLIICTTWPNVHKLRSPSECFFFLSSFISCPIILHSFCSNTLQSTFWP